jgi:putative ABC transport system substrate-binding protein
MQGAEGLSAKWAELLKEALPEVTRVGYLWNPTNPPSVANFKQVQRVAQALGMNIHSFPVQHAGELDGAFAAMTKERVGGLVVDPTNPLIAYQARVAELAMKHRLPAITVWRNFAEAGVLMAYGPSLQEQFRRAAAYVDKILKGAKPSDLPVEQPTKFELVINLKAARTIGLTVPQMLLDRADEVIE